MHPPRPIPGHSKPKPCSKSPKTKSPRSLDSAGKSPKSLDSGKSPKSPVSDIVGLPDEELRKLKLSLLATSPDR